MSDLPADAAAAVSRDVGVDGGVPGGRELRRFALAALDRGPDAPAALGAARDDLVRAVGPDGMVDAAAVVAFFDAINRVADGVGTELEAPLQEGANALLGGLDLSSMRAADV